ncbi:thymosin beta-like isoform X1 [Mercenaria mercenaria]|uniref:thymosin beta-like isoform X1 n=1 Tax=Mercenaria mercenaria TaxID=6596 RepID=UPI00234F59BE|nr:thymosin beta-like isoform X1 [Mercenaria mercenaria]XP_053399814.1 thymosin beta-like isoform X1 [Mercenaria mercenaria]XP_053399815.1 thymosin beta-like isoform X1 [Mercenaria mercenaria]
MTDHKADPALLKDIEGGTKLKHAETEEKNPLPSAEVISQEKTKQAIETFDPSNLKHTQTAEKTGWKEAMSHDKATEELGKFDKSSLKHAETAEKNPLPDKEAIAEEKKELEHRKSIGEFDKSQLRRQNTEEKIVLPSKEAISQEKQEVELRQSINKHDRSSLKKVDMCEKDGLKELVAQEATHKGIENFSKDQLKHAETQEKNPLPTKEDIQAEKKAGK